MRCKRGDMHSRCKICPAFRLLGALPPPQTPTGALPLDPIRGTTPLGGLFVPQNPQLCLPNVCLLAILTASPWRTGGDHRDAPNPILYGWRLPSRTWNQWTSPSMKQLTWLRIAHSGDWCLRLVLRIHSGPCQKWWWWFNVYHWCCCSCCIIFLLWMCS